MNRELKRLKKQRAQTFMHLNEAKAFLKQLPGIIATLDEVFYNQNVEISKLNSSTRGESFTIADSRSLPYGIITP